MNEDANNDQLYHDYSTPRRIPRGSPDDIARDKISCETAHKSSTSNFDMGIDLLKRAQELRKKNENIQLGMPESLNHLRPVEFPVHYPITYAGEQKWRQLIFEPLHLADASLDDMTHVFERKSPILTDYHVEMASLFFFQLRHDERYHRDINNLPLMDRLKHLHNHIVKYHAVIQRKLDNAGDSSKEITDGVIVCLSALVALGYGGYTLESLGDYYIKQSIIRDNDIIHELGAISKVLEGYDHVEALKYIPTLTEHFQRLFVKFLSLYYINVGKVFREAYLKRMQFIQERNPLHHKFVATWGKIEL